MASDRPVSRTDARDDIESFVAGPAHVFLEKLGTPADLAEWLQREERGHEPDPFAVEALAYSLLLAGRAQEAERWLEVTAESASAYIRTDLEEGLYAEDEEHPLRAVARTHGRSAQRSRRERRGCDRDSGAVAAGDSTSFGALRAPRAPEGVWG